MEHKEKSKSLFKSKKLLILIVVLAFVAVHLAPTSQKIVYASENYKDYSNQKLIALTFDDGPSKNIPELLELLDKYNAKATFFILGNKAEDNPELVKAIFDKGHLVGNHTYSHERMWFVSPKKLNESIEKTNNILEKITGARPDFFRPPHGSIITYTVKTIPMVCVNWSLDTIDWKHKDADDLAKKLISKVRDGTIVLMHDKIDSTIEGLKVALPELQKEGFSFVTVKELLTRNGKSAKSGATYYSSSNKFSGLKL